VRRGRVLHVITRLDRGGSADNTISSCLRLAERGWDVSLAHGPTTDPSPLMEDLRRFQAIACTGIPTLVRPIRPVMDLRAAADLIRLMAGGRYDIVHTHSSKAGLLGRWAARRLGVPAVHTPHGHVFEGYFGPALTRAIVAAERLAARWCERIVVLTDKGMRDHLARGVGRAGQFVTISSGVPLERVRGAREARAFSRAALGIRPDEIVVGCVARLVPVKGQEHLLGAASVLSERLPGLKVLLAGDGELRRPLERLAAALGMEGRVIFLGAVRDPVQALAAMDLFALPSLNEGQGRAVVEAMAAGVPVIASDVGGLPEVLDGGAAGLLVPPANPKALARAILSLAMDPARRARLAAAAGLRARRYDEAVMIEKLDRLYLEMLGHVPMGEALS